MRSVVTFTVNNRPHYFRDVLRTWECVRGADRWDFHFSVEPSPVQDAMLSLIRDFKHPSFTVVNPERYGVLENPYRSLDRAFAFADFAVLAEEDLIVADDVLEYFEWCRDELQANQRVLTVCAKSGDGPAEEVQLGPVFGVHIWGTWRDRWHRTIEPTWDHDYSTHRPGAPGQESGWDWNLNKRVIPGGGFLSAFPSQSRADNIGAVGDHARPEDFEASQAPNYRSHREPVCYRLVTPSAE